MSSVDREILSFIKKIRMRIHRNIMINYVIWGIVIALCCGSLVSIAALLIPLYKVHIVVFKLVGAGVLIALLASLLKIPKNDKAARVADSLGLKERAVTALELLGEETNFAQLQKKDTLERLKGLEYKERLNFSINRKQIILFIVFIFIIVSSGFIPTKARDKAEEKYKFNIMQEEKLANIEKVEKDIKKNSSLKDEDRKELLENLSSLKKEIKDAKSVTDINNSLAKFQIKTDSLKEKFRENDLNNVASGLSRNNYTNNLANAIERGDKEEISREISNLPEALKNSTEEEQKKLSQDFADTAKNTEDKELKKSLNDIAEKLAGNNPEKFKELNSSLEAFKDSLQKSMENKYAKNELKSIQNDFMPEKKYGDNSSPQNSGAQNPSSGNQQEGNQQGNGQQGSNQNGQNGNNASEEGKGQPGASSPDGQKPSEEQKPGSNPNDNTGNNNENSNDKPGNSGSNNGKSGNDSSGLSKPGSSNSSEGESVYLPPPPEKTGEAPKSQNLDKVIGKYKEKAYENMNSFVIPEAMKDIIKNYFSSLEQ